MCYLCSYVIICIFMIYIHLNALYKHLHVLAIYICIYMYNTYIHTYIHSYIYIRIYIHAHIYMPSPQPSREPTYSRSQPLLPPCVRNQGLYSAASQSHRMTIKIDQQVVQVYSSFQRPINRVFVAAPSRQPSSQPEQLLGKPICVISPTRT